MRGQRGRRILTVIQITFFSFAVGDHQTLAIGSGTNGKNTDGAMNKPAAVVLLCMLAVMADAATPPATIVFYRLGGDADVWRVPITVDGVQAHKIGSMKRWTITLAPGSHTIVSRDKQYEISLLVESGRTYYIKIDVFVGTFRGHAVRAIVVPTEIANGETVGLKIEK